MFLDFPNAISLRIEVKNQSDDLDLLGHTLQYAVRTFGIAEGLGVVEKCLSTSHAATDTKLVFSLQDWLSA